jgi:glycosyltransferase involved in cell wall biosynthesis
MRIFFLSTVSPFDCNSWSGITYHSYHSLALEHELVWSGKPVLNYIERKKLALATVWRRWRKKHYTDQNVLYAKILSAWAERELARYEVDVIVVGSGEPEAFAYLRTSIPIIYIADSTFSLKVGYYPWHKGLAKDFLREGELVESLAIGRASHIIYSSAWAANSAVRDHHASWSKLSVVPFGPNLRRVPSEINHPGTEVLRLLFIGTDWKRKGGDNAIEVYKILKASLFCELLIVGSDPVLEPDAGILVIPYLDKNIEGDEQRYQDILASSHFLLLPTQADCTPVVISEAAAFGVPVISYNTGGVSELLNEGITGFCLPEGSEPAKMAYIILEIWGSMQKYRSMKTAIRNDFENRLNWQNWLQKINEVFYRLLK